MTLIKNLSSEYDIHFGIDVDKKSFSFTVYDDKMSNKSKKIPSNAEQFHTYIKKNYPDKKVLCAYEAGPTGYHLYDYLKSKSCDCFVISPNSIPKPSNEKVKNNKIDSRKIVEYLKSGHLKSIRIPIGNYRELRHLVRIREVYTSKRKVARQRIQALLLFAHLYPYVQDSESNWSALFIKSLKNIPCSDAVRIRLDMLLMDLEYARQQLLSIYRKMKTFIKNNSDIYKNIGYLKSIPGIGFITATSILAKIGDPSNLKNIRELACFIGVIPTEHSTGEKIKKGNITHMGDRKLRSLLIESAWVSIRCDTELNQFFYRIMRRNHPKGAAQKAIVAVTRKLTQRIYKVLKEQRMYVIH